MLQYALGFMQAESGPRRSVAAKMRSRALTLRPSNFLFAPPRALDVTSRASDRLPSAENLKVTQTA